MLNVSYDVTLALEAPSSCVFHLDFWRDAHAAQAAYIARVEGSDADGHAFQRVVLGNTKAFPVRGQAGPADSWVVESEYLPIQQEATGNAGFGINASAALPDRSVGPLRVTFAGNGIFPGALEPGDLGEPPSIGDQPPVLFDLECDSPFSVQAMAGGVDFIMIEEDTTKDGTSVRAGPAAAVHQGSATFEAQAPRVEVLAAASGSGEGTMEFVAPGGQATPWSFARDDPLVGEPAESFRLGGGPGAYEVRVVEFTGANVFGVVSYLLVAAVVPLWPAESFEAILERPAGPA